MAQDHTVECKGVLEEWEDPLVEAVLNALQEVGISSEPLTFFFAVGKVRPVLMNGKPAMKAVSQSIALPAIDDFLPKWRDALISVSSVCSDTIVTIYADRKVHAAIGGQLLNE